MFSLISLNLDFLVNSTFFCFVSVFMECLSDSTNDFYEFSLSIFFPSSMWVGGVMPLKVSFSPQVTFVEDIFT